MFSLRMFSLHVFLPVCWLFCKGFEFFAYGNFKVPTKLIIESNWSTFSIASSAGAVEYTDCISAMG